MSRMHYAACGNCVLRLTDDGGSVSLTVGEAQTAVELMNNAVQAAQKPTHAPEWVPPGQHFVAVALENVSCIPVDHLSWHSRLHGIPLPTQETRPLVWETTLGLGSRFDQVVKHADMLRSHHREVAIARLQFMGSEVLS